jgi:hypothetical protein
MLAEEVVLEGADLSVGEAVEIVRQEPGPAKKIEF